MFAFVFACRVLRTNEHFEIDVRQLTKLFNTNEITRTIFSESDYKM